MSSIDQGSVSAPASPGAAGSMPAVSHGHSALDANPAAQTLEAEWPVIGETPERCDPRCRDILVPLRLVLTKADALAAQAADPDKFTIAVPELLTWQLNSVGQLRVKPTLSPIDWVDIAIDGRIITICPASDFRHKQADVEALEIRATEVLSLGAKRVMVEVLPHSHDGTRQTLQEFIDVSGTDMFRAIAGIARPCFKEGKAPKVYSFDPEPEGTHARGIYLIPTVGRNWMCCGSESRSWWHWCGTHWSHVVGNEQLESEIEQFFEIQQWRNREPSTVKGLVSALRRALPTLRPVGTSGMIPFLNGCLRLSDHRLLGHDRVHGNTWRLPYDYQAGAQANGIVEFLTDRFQNSEALALFRAFANVMLKRRRTKTFLELFGPSNTGKSVISNLLMATVGFDNVTASTLELLENRRLLFQTQKLRNKTLVVFSEAQNYNGPLEVLKSLTGGDRIAAEAKGSNAEVDFFFEGSVLIVGNGPIGATDTTGAVLSRRRSIPILTVVPEDQRRPLLDADGQGGWSGEFVSELPGFVNWVLLMPDDEVVSVLNRPIRSSGSPQTEFATLVRSDPFAAWAEDCLVYAPETYSRVGDGRGKPSEFLYPNYVEYHHSSGEPGRSIPLRMFKEKLVGLLRDHYSLGLPPGCLQSGPYRVRGEGSVIPAVRLRTSDEGQACEASPGVIRYAIQLCGEPPSAVTGESSGSAGTDGSGRTTQVNG